MEKQSSSQSENFSPFESEPKIYSCAFWRNSLAPNRFNVYAVISKKSDLLYGWVLEVRGDRIYHPAYGVLSRDEFDEVDLFTENYNGKTPSSIFSLGERGFYFAGHSIHEIYSAYI